MHDKMERDDRFLGLEYLIYIKNVSTATFSDIIATHVHLPIV